MHYGLGYLTAEEIRVVGRRVETARTTHQGASEVIDIKVPSIGQLHNHDMILLLES